MVKEVEEGSESTQLTDKQHLFCLSYLTDLNGTRAAIAAGYSERSAAEIASENLRKPNIRQFIDNHLRERVISSEETVKLISDIAKSSVNDYLTVKKIERRPKIEKHLSLLIQEKENEIEFERLVSTRIKMSDERIAEFEKEQQYRREDVIRMQTELEMNPNASRIVLGDPELVEVADIDMVKLAKDKEFGRIKSVSWTEFGPKVELYAADAALRDMAKIYGKFEKDNAQKQPIINTHTEEKFNELLKAAREGSQADKSQ